MKGIVVRQRPIHYARTGGRTADREPTTLLRSTANGVMIGAGTVVGGSAAITGISGALLAAAPVCLIPIVRECAAVIGGLSGAAAGALFATPLGVAVGFFGGVGGAVSNLVTRGPTLVHTPRTFVAGDRESLETFLLENVPHAYWKDFELKQKSATRWQMRYTGDEGNRRGDPRVKVAEREEWLSTSASTPLPPPVVTPVVPRPVLVTAPPMEPEPAAPAANDALVDRIQQAQARLARGRNS